MEFLNIIIQFFKEQPNLLYCIIFVILLVCIGARINREDDNPKTIEELENDLNSYKETNSYDNIISTCMDIVHYHSYQGKDINFDDFYDRNYRNNNDEIISICSKVIDYAENNKHLLDKTRFENLDFFYYRRGESYEFKGNYELAIEDYKQSILTIKDESTQERIDICYKKLKGQNDSI